MIQVLHESKYMSSYAAQELQAQIGEGTFWAEDSTLQTETLTETLAQQDYHGIATKLTVNTIGIFTDNIGTVTKNMTKKPSFEA